MSKGRVLVLGGGEMASGAICQLAQARFEVVVTELLQPQCVRRLVSYASAVYDGRVVIEGVEARRAERPESAGFVPVVVDPDARLVRTGGWDALVDGRMAKANLGTRITDAPLVIGLGPGFTAGADCHVVIETSRGPDLGRVIECGSARPDSGAPEPVEGVGAGRVVRAPADGLFRAERELGAIVAKGDRLGTVGSARVTAGCAGVLRGLLHDGVEVRRGAKVGDVYPRTDIDIRRISDKALAIGTAVWKVAMRKCQSLRTAARVQVVGIHPVRARERCHLIEVRVLGVEGPPDVGAFTQEDPCKPYSSWQVAYDEHYLDADGGRVLGNRFPAECRPEAWRGDVRVAFFLHFLDSARPLWTPFGEVQLPAPTRRPRRLRMIRYEPPD